MFNEGWYFMISRASDIFLFTLLLLCLLRSTLTSFGDTGRWPDWIICFSMGNLLLLPAFSIISLFIRLVVSPEEISEHSTKYIRSCLCSSFVCSFISNEDPSMCCDTWFSGNNLLNQLLTDLIIFCPCLRL